MAQAEDTELRDLVIEALERNGSLAKIRALLRANIFLAFEDECENLKQNINLDNVLKLPEGLLALSVIHEFLEFCCLKNTLFVYMSESRQGNEYHYEGKKKMADKLNFNKCDMKEPILLTLIKNMLKPHQKKYDPNVNSNFANHDTCDEKNYREEENCTYILHEDSQSSATSTSQSDNSSDEKNKLHLRLQLDNSDTDTSSDSARDKTNSEYIPGDHILQMNESNIQTNVNPQKSIDNVTVREPNKLTPHSIPGSGTSVVLNELKLTTSSSDSTSYIDLKPFNSLDEKLLNTAGLPTVNTDLKDQTKSIVAPVTNVQAEQPSPKSVTVSITSAASMKESDNKILKENQKNSQSIQESAKSEGDTADFSYGDDFSPSPVSKYKDVADKQQKSSESLQEKSDKSVIKNLSVESPHQTSQSSQSSVSISDVADLISEKSLSLSHNKSRLSDSIHSKGRDDRKQSKVHSDDSGDFTESPVPSLSNLSLDIHSD
ncbi:unnamed protein product [Chrysodeixis includens]|uniref:FGFR1 oncogene partner n=1 Tax=Chrysodeixis includens TaxID=689277 RepID=A0A9N8PX92_CHRIL|nr:unnamed protein product [Chrysodeixis includens]